MFCSSAGSPVVHDQELKRLRVELVAWQATLQSGIMKMLGAEACFGISRGRLRPRDVDTSGKSAA